MATEYKQIKPSDVFFSFSGREATEAERWMGMPSGKQVNRPSGNSFIDLFASLVNKHRNESSGFYARLLQAPSRDLNGCMKLLTGMDTDAWIEVYCQLMAEDILQTSGCSIEEVAKQVGYTLSSFSRVFARHHGISPTRWRRENRRAR